jgi:hypothetical protein
MGWVKLIAVLTIVGMVGYSYKWTYDKGYVVAEAEVKVNASKALGDALREQELEFRALRALEMREAAEVAAQNLRNEQKKVADLKRINDALKNDECASKPIPADVISVLNSFRSPDTPPK